MLAELAEIGMELARDVRRQALDGGVTAAGGAEGGNLGLAFSRIARAVRQTMALEARLAADEAAVAQQVSAAQASRAAAERKRARQTKERVRGLVEAAIAEAGDGDRGEATRENLLLDLDEQLEDPDIDLELLGRPIGVVVAGICAALGIDVDLSHFSDAELGFDTASMSRKAEAGPVADQRADPLVDPDDADDPLAARPPGLPPWPPD